jgi:SpoVK/Ycf46/Vps4 family AAA+-type ATPase
VAEVESLARLWQRETTLLPLALYVDAHDMPNAGESAPATAAASVSRFVGRASGLIFVATRDATGSPGARDVVRVEVAKPTFEEQQDAWLRELTREPGSGDAAPAATGTSAAAPDAALAADADAERLAAQFDLGVVAIQRIGDAARALSSGDAVSLADRLWSAAVEHSRPKLDALAQRIEPKATWDQLVLPNQEERALRALAAQVRRRATVYETWGFARRMNRGLGISALFAGESGTGKTMAAEVVANDLRLALYRIDLSAVVSKYIGETEKNLRRVFDAAEGGGAILFFDEADALFGKRSEVKDSHDRYANIEINYLLQRMEGYRGVAILATYLMSALDSAFMRRLRFVVTFPFPAPNERRAIWQQAFPDRERVKQLDYDRLARLPLSGGSIQSVALNAAFLAAAADSRVTMPLVLDAARAELRKLDLAVNESDLRWIEPVVEVA